MIKAILQTWRGNKADPDTIKTLQDKRLKELVRYARAYSPFYQRLYAAIGDDFRLEDLPPTSKPQMMSRLDEVFTDQRITTERIAAF